MNRKLTNIQRDVLGTVQARAPITAGEVGDNLLIDYGRAKSALDSLERKVLVARDYSSRSYSSRGYGWTITRAGAVALQSCLDEPE